MTGPFIVMMWEMLVVDVTRFAVLVFVFFFGCVHWVSVFIVCVCVFYFWGDFLVLNYLKLSSVRC